MVFGARGVGSDEMRATWLERGREGEITRREILLDCAQKTSTGDRIADVSTPPDEDATIDREDRCVAYLTV